MTENYLAAFFSEAHIEYYASLPIEFCNLHQEWFARRHMTFTPKSVLLYLIPYYVSEGKNISAYATSHDYHHYAKILGETLKEGLATLYPEDTFLSLCDASPLDERRAAAKAGLGALGDNGLLINAKYGSYVFIGEILSTLPADAFGCEHIGEVEECLHCGTCQGACPTACLSDSGRPCLSYITQKKGPLTEEEVSLLQSGCMAWGCDVCQTVCPMNCGEGKPTLSPIPFFYQERITHLTEDTLAQLDDDAFSRYAFAWRGRSVIERNLSLLGENPRKH